MSDPLEGMTSLSTSVIVRTKDKAATIVTCLTLLRRQTVPVEIVVVDSGSSDGTLELAWPFCDRLIEIRPEEFSYGRALNVGAAAATGDIHMAVSAHAFLQREDWVELALRHYERARVAAVTGSRLDPEGERLTSVIYPDVQLSRRAPLWGFSNTASSWRASVWRDFRFDEELEACEDKEWAWRVLDAGWAIAVDPALWISGAHRRRDGLLELYRRVKREGAALTRLGALPRYSAGSLLSEWWQPGTRLTPYRRLRRRTSYYRMVELAGTYAGQRAELRKERTP